MKTKLFQRFVLVALFSLGVLAETKSDYDRDYDFSRLRTWDFKRMHRMPTDPIGENPIWDERIRRAIEQHLTEAGFQRVVEGAPDFLVSYYLGVKERYDVRYLDYGFPGFWGHWGGWGGWGPGIGTVNVWKIPYTESTLVIDIIDPSTNQLIWRGYDTETIDFNKSEKTINNSVEDLIKRLVHDLKEAEKKREKK